MLLTLASSMGAFAQVFDPVAAIEIHEEMIQIENDYKSSEVVKSFVEGVEQRYGVECSANSRVSYSTLTGKVSFKTSCSGDTPVRIKIVSVCDKPQFRVVKEIIKRK